MATPPARGRWSGTLSVPLFPALALRLCSRTARAESTSGFSAPWPK